MLNEKVPEEMKQAEVIAEKKDSKPKVQISPEVLATIASLSVADEPELEKMLKKGKGKAITASVEGEEIKVNVELSISYGIKLPEITKRVQSKIQTSLENMTGMKVKAVDISVTAMTIEKS